MSNELLREEIKKRVHAYKHASEPRFLSLLGSRIPEDWALDVIIDELIKPLQEQVKALSE